MRFHRLHPWRVSIQEARDIQNRLRDKIILQDQLSLPIQYVAGTDVGFVENGTVTRAAVAVLSFPELKLIESQVALTPTSFAYVPGFLSFREVPALLLALEKLQHIPQLILCDGQGIAHPRRLGLASHLGLLCDVPTIGVAKTRFIGTHDAVPARKGSWVPLYDAGEQIGAVVCTRDRVKPVYVSPGHRVSLHSAIQYTLACVGRYRLPETTRFADRLASLA